MIRASSLYRYRLCPGSLALEAKCPELPPSEDASAGALQHAVLSGTADMKLLTSEQRAAVQWCHADTELLIERTFGEVRPKIFCEIEMDLDGFISGHPDFIAVHKDTAIVLDRKFGRNEVDPAEINDQIRAYSLMTQETFGVEYVLGGIQQPHASLDSRRSLTMYGPKELSEAKIDLKTVHNEAQKPDAPLNPGKEQCRYCRAKAICPAVSKWESSIVKLDLSLIPMEHAAELYVQADVLGKRSAEVKQIIYNMVQNAQAENRPTPGFELKPGIPKRQVESAQAAFDALRSLCPDLKDEVFARLFTECCSVGIGALDSLVARAKNLSEGNAKKLVTGALKEAGCLSYTKPQASLKLVKEEKAAA